MWWGRASGPLSPQVAPLLTIHGGPGICHDCLEPLAALGADRPVIFYDQYGCGRSDRAVDADEYDIELFVDEIAAVRETLGLDRVHLFAHSYGGPLLLEYLLQHRPVGVLSVTLSNTFASTPGLSRGWDRRLAELPDGYGVALRSGPHADPEAFSRALMEFMARFIMHGTSWFSPDGLWSTWDATSRLGEIRVPTLVIGGTRDQCVPELAKELGTGIPGAEVVVLDAAHLPFFEVPGEYLTLVRDFLARSDSDR